MKILLFILMELLFDTQGNEKQKECASYWADDITTDLVYGGAKAGGKSFMGCSLIFGDAFIYPGTSYFIARKVLQDVRKFTIPSIHEVFEIWNINPKQYKFNGVDNYFTLNNGSKVYLLDCKYIPSDPLYQRFGSMQFTRGWIEEAGEFELEAKNSLAISLGRWKNDKYKLAPKLLQTCNPVKNYLYREYYKKWRDGELESWKQFIQAFPQDNKMLPKGYIDNLLRTLTKNEIERLVYGNWEYDDDPATLIEYDNILNLFTNKFVEEGDSYITADIARLGRDCTRIGVWKGFVLVEVVTLEKNKITEAAEAIRELSNTYRVPMSRTIVDEDGVGGGVADILGCKGFVNNSRPLLGENYNHLKSQCYFKFAERVNANGYYFPAKISEREKELIIEELEQVKKDKIDKDGKQCIIPKDKVKQLIARSPDFSDMLMMREWFELNIMDDFMTWG